LKVCFYGFAGYRYILLEIIKLFGKELDWSIILPTYHNKELFYNVLEKGKVCYLYNDFNKYFENLNNDHISNILENYYGNFYEDLMADKITLKKKSSLFQEKHGITTYLIYKDFLEKNNPDFLFFPHMETHEARILFATAKELNIKTIVYSHARNFGVSFYSKEYWQKIPENIEINENDIKIASQFIENFRKNPNRDIPDIEISFNKENLYNKINMYKTSLKQAILENLKYRFGKEKYYHGEDTLIQKARTRFIKYTEILFYKPKFTYIVNKYFKKLPINELPENFIYFPLQITPESSTNNFEPYYVDHIRAIDLLRKSMPNNYKIVLKDHPSYFGRRPLSFYETLSKLPGTILIDTSVNSLELIKRSKLVSSITGTANLEALLLGKKSLIFGKCFFYDYVYKYNCFFSFKDDLNKILSSDDKEKLYKNSLELTAKILKIGKKFILFESLDLYFRRNNVTLVDQNLKIAYDSLKEFMCKYEKY